MDFLFLSKEFKRKKRANEEVIDKIKYSASGFYDNR